MRTILICGLVVGGVITLWNWAVVIAGAYTSIVLGFWVVLGLELIGAAWALHRTARQGRGYWGQVLAGTLVFTVVAVMLFGGTYFAWTVLAPDYADVIVETQRQRVLDGGDPPPDLEDRLERLHAMYTPIRQSAFVVPPTIVTGLVSSLLLAPFIRRRGVPTEPS